MSAAAKQLSLKIFLGALALIIMGLWLMNLKNSIVTNEEPNLSADSFAENFNNNLKENANLVDSFSEDEKIFVNQLLVEANNLDIATDTPDSVFEEPENNNVPTETNELELPELIDSESSDFVAPVATNCPAYVNCMPTSDAEPRPCVIPPGCEGITEKVY
ncbi:MAG: hypothetical protein JST_000612 [Candidatus Parcubacteria bacterium]|jgi:hypothetical protein|nr:MAG: hypothetical protein JST_5720 [Candidatus Parcubacteria bacterium]